MGKETVLALLLREKGHFVSGEAVSAELGITRAAIWKSISALRAQGYEIDAVTGRGYCLKSLPDTLTEQTVRSYLGPVETVGKRIDCFPSDIDELEAAKPVYEYLPGFNCDISNCRSVEDLPKEALDYIRYIEKAVNCPIKYVSVGAEREAYIHRG